MANISGPHKNAENYYIFAAFLVGLQAISSSKKQEPRLLVYFQGVEFG